LTRASTARLLSCPKVELLACGGAGPRASTVRAAIAVDRSPLARRRTFRITCEGQKCSVRSRSTPEGVLKVSAIKPTFS